MAANLANRWTRLCKKFTSDEALITNCYREIRDHYCEPGRYYHNFEHLQSLFSMAKKHWAEIEDSEAMDFGIWYHDLVYQPGSKENEERSAQIAAERLRALGFPVGRTVAVCNLIRATAGHRISGSRRRDLALFLDFDLSILASSWNRYHRYALALRKEYATLAAAAYRSGRKAFLGSLLQRRHIFNTELFRRKEAKARANIRREIETSLT